MQSRPGRAAQAHFELLVHELAGAALLSLSSGAAGFHPVDLQILYWLRTQPPTTTLDFKRSLSQWVGSKRQEPLAFGDESCLEELPARLLPAGLIWEMGVPVKRLVVSPAGIALLQRLPAAWEDLDLPWRLARWEAEWPASIGMVERYVRAMFTALRAQPTLNIA